MALRDDIERLLEAGVSSAETARQLGVAGPTVAYHAARLGLPESRAAIASAESRRASHAALPTTTTREQVARLISEGHTHAAIATRLGVTRSTVTYHTKRLGLPTDARGARRYDWQVIQAYYDAGHSVRECQARFGFSRQSWWAAVKRGAVRARPHGMALGQLLVAGVYRGRHNLKARLVRAGLKKEACERCGIFDWQGRPLAFALHHVNGDRHDNRIENLELLCPNCHAQTGNHSRRGRDEDRAA